MLLKLSQNFYAAFVFSLQTTVIASLSYAIFVSTFTYFFAHEYGSSMVIGMLMYVIPVSALCSFALFTIALFF